MNTIGRGWPEAPRSALLSLIFLSVAAGCGDFFPDPLDAEAESTTPEGIQKGTIVVDYVLTGSAVTVDLKVTFSTDGGLTFDDATMGSGGDGVDDLSVSAAGEPHVFAWDSAADLDGARNDSVVVRLRPSGGLPAATESFSVHNSRFLVAVESVASGTIRLYKADENDAEIEFKQTRTTGGSEPFDVIFRAGFFLVVHEGSNDVAVFRLNEASESLSVVSGTDISPAPVPTDGTGSRYLAAAGDFVIVSNTTSDTLSVFELDPDTGALQLTPTSGTSAPGCAALTARDTTVYVVSETDGGILVFHLDADGELTESVASPIVSGGLDSPRALALVGDHLLVANGGAATVSVFDIDGDGELSPVAGSPFVIPSAMVEHLAGTQGHAFAVTGSEATLIHLLVSASGTVTTSGASLALADSSLSVVTSGTVVVATIDADPQLAAWTLSSGGFLASVAVDVDEGDEFVRLTLSD